jgi:hypothetical protein
MIGPGRTAEPHRGCGSEPLEQLGSHAQGAGAAGGMGGGRPAADYDLAVGAEQQILDTDAIARIAGYGQVALGLFTAQQDTLGVFDASKNRGDTLFVFVYPGTEIDFIRALIFLEGLGKAENRIGRGGFNIFPHGYPLFW